MDKSLKKIEIVPFLSGNIKKLFDNIGFNNWDNLNELRVNVSKPLIADVCGERYYISDSGLSKNNSNSYISSSDDINIIMELITKSSVYAYNRHINSGYITLPGGNRVGICGNCNISDGKIISVNEINSLNIRISHEKKGVGDIVFPDIYANGKAKNTLIISPPGCGKTTMLRDIARIFSDASRCNKIIICAIIDERYELACSRGGITCFDVGDNNFVISGCQKSTAIPMVTRCMSPDIIITDELGNKDDFKAIIYAAKSGCAVIASVHGINETNHEMQGYDVSSYFEKIIILSRRNGPGTIEQIMEV
ncbi:MAG: stage III sporulation protein AA [Clostridia bacterium]|nr:stage III sporulation protein AA [Clostridia bacterium]